MRHAALAGAIVVSSGCMASGDRPLLARVDRAGQHVSPVGWTTLQQAFFVINGRCEHYVPRVEIIEPPRHGESVVGDSGVYLRHLSGDLAHCNTGALAEQKSIRYRAQPGYHGPDRIVVRITPPNGKPAQTRRLALIVD
ncbi:MAG: hypothetical protein KGL46_00725 [Hyphomicrobiales bacterium]|nr:hypothetical protein [Hyphomicrobiales bacterium]